MGKRRSSGGWRLLAAVLASIGLAVATPALGAVPATAAELPTGAVIAAARSNPIPVGAVSVTSFGAVGDGVSDDTAAIQRALDSLPEGGTLAFPAGSTFRHTAVLTVGRPGVRLTGGGTLLATSEQASAVLLRNNNIRVDNLTLRMASTSRRWVEYEKMKLRLGPYSGIRVTDVLIDGSAAAGVYIGGARNFSLSRVTVRNTRADAVHITEGASLGTVSDVVVRNSGDDGIAIVSYAGDGDPVSRDITILRPRVFGQSWGRAFAVVGGDRISWRNVYAERSSAAAIYLATEAHFNTHPTTNILVDGATITCANQTASVDHGAVVLFNGTAGVTNRNLTVRNLTVSDTRASASRQVSIINAAGARHARVTITNVVVNRGPATTFWTNAPAASYRLSGWTDDGVAVAPRIGW
jgi:hypothetical protein